MKCAGGRPFDSEKGGGPVSTFWQFKIIVKNHCHQKIVISNMTKHKALSYVCPYVLYIFIETVRGRPFDSEKGAGPGGYAMSYEDKQV